MFFLMPTNGSDHSKNFGWCCPENESVDNQITSAESAALQDAAQAMLGQSVNGLSGGGTFPNVDIRDMPLTVSLGLFLTIADEAYQHSVPFKMYQVTWLGQDTC